MVVPSTLKGFMKLIKVQECVSCFKLFDLHHLQVLLCLSFKLYSWFTFPSNADCESDLYHPTSALGLTNVRMSEWEQIFAARLQSLMERLKPEEWGLFEKNINAHSSVRLLQAGVILQFPHTFGRKVLFSAL